MISSQLGTLVRRRSRRRRLGLRVPVDDPGSDEVARAMMSISSPTARLDSSAISTVASSVSSSAAAGRCSAALRAGRGRCSGVTDAARSSRWEIS